VSNVTLILERASGGDPQAAEELLPLVYDELRKLAAAKLARESPGQTLQATALVHEAWLRLGGDQQSWQSRSHFFAAAAEAMRRILIEIARRKSAIRHGGEQQRVELNTDITLPETADVFLRVNDFIEELAQSDPLRAQVVKLKYFVGLENAEIARMLNTSERTVHRAWSFAKSWLFSRLSAPTGEVAK
jgi:RNA polymerase sigma factor (TIGR02999 family)